MFYTEALIDRMSEKRSDADFIAAQLANPETVLLPVWRGQNLIDESANSPQAGGLTIAEGDYSTAMGWFTDAASYAEVVIGRFNEMSESDDEAWRDADAVFRVGIGSSEDQDDRQDAFRVMKGGQVKVKKNDDESMWDVADELEELNDDMDQAQQDIEKLDMRMTSCPCPPLLAGGRRLSPAADDEVETLKKDNEALKARVDALEAAMAKLIK